LVSSLYIIGIVIEKDRIGRGESFRLQYRLINSRFGFTHPHLLREVDFICCSLNFWVFLWPERGVQAVGVRQHDNPVTLLAKFMHDVDNLRADCDKYSLPAVGELFVA